MMRETIINISKTHPHKRHKISSGKSFTEKKTTLQVVVVLL